MNRTFQTFLLCTTLLSLSACRSREGVPNTVTDTQKPFTLQQSGAGVSSVVVKDDETVYSIAYAHGVTSHAIIAINDLSPPYALRPGQVIQLPNPGEHIVRDGESLESIAAIYGLSAMVLAQENHIDMGSPLHKRQRLIVPAKDTKPVVADAAAASSGAPMIAARKLDPVGTPPNTIGHQKSEGHKPGTFAGGAGTTALANELPSDLASELAQEKGGKQAEKTSAPAAAPVPSLVKEPSAPQKTNAENMTSAMDIPPIAPSKPLNTIAPPTSLAKGEPAKAKSEPAKPAASPVLAEKSAPAKEQAVAAVSFIKPVSGNTIAKFGDKVATGKNDGINIKAPMGTPVKAAADGTVVYAGKGLEGFGNLVIIKHKDGWVTAYGHNSVIDGSIKKGATVKQGQSIAKVGKTGDVNEPQLHFEIRKGTQPIDPMSKLGS